MAAWPQKVYWFIYWFIYSFICLLAKLVILGLSTLPPPLCL
jgi:hypothetical protein